MSVPLLPHPIPTGEEPFRRLVRHLAQLYGWDRELMYHTHRSDRSDPGWVDEVFGSARQQRTIFVEFKSATGKPTAPQVRWLAHLHACGFEVALWRPQVIDEVIAVLGPARKRATLPAALLSEVA